MTIDVPLIQTNLGILRFAPSIKLNEYEMILINLRKFKKRSRGILKNKAILNRTKINLLSNKETSWC